MAAKKITLSRKNYREYTLKQKQKRKRKSKKGDTPGKQIKDIWKDVHES